MYTKAVVFSCCLVILIADGGAATRNASSSEIFILPVAPDDSVNLVDIDAPRTVREYHDGYESVKSILPAKLNYATFDRWDPTIDNAICHFKGNGTDSMARGAIYRETSSGGAAVIILSAFIGARNSEYAYDETVVELTDTIALAESGGFVVTATLDCELRGMRMKQILRGVTNVEDDPR